MGTVVADGSRSYQRHVKLLDYQDETAHAYIFDLFPDREPPTKSGEACELVLGRESDGQGHGPPLTEPPNDNSVRGDTTIYLLRDEFGHLISGPEDPSFVFWTLEPKAEDIKPENAS